MGCGAETEANTLLTSLVSGEDFTVPAVDLSGWKYNLPIEQTDDLYKEITPLNITAVASGVGSPTGSAYFDVLMKSAAAHLKVEWEAGRISGGEYTKAYIAIIESCMAGALNFAVQRDQSFWASKTAQINAITALTLMENAKLQFLTLKFEALNTKANYALSKIKLSTESMSYCTAKYNLEQILPIQKAQLEAQTDLVVKQQDQLDAQIELINEQKESARAQTLNTRSDGTTNVVGVLGKQKDLYTQQITSYQRDAENKAAKLFTDAWITMKTMDEGLLPPTNFQNTSLDAILADLKTNNGLG